MVLVEISYQDSSASALGGGSPLPKQKKAYGLLVKEDTSAYYLAQVIDADGQMVVSTVVYKQDGTKKRSLIDLNAKAEKPTKPAPKVEEPKKKS